jgi:hypothetical protein
MKYLKPTNSNYNIKVHSTHWFVFTVSACFHSLLKRTQTTVGKSSQRLQDRKDQVRLGQAYPG